MIAEAEDTFKIKDLRGRGRGRKCASSNMLKENRINNQFGAWKGYDTVRPSE
jgi:hypothetical protein